MRSLKALPKSKTRNSIPIWTEFNQLATKYNGLNLCHGTPSLAPPEFLIDNMKATVSEGMNNHYTAFPGHPLLREQIAKHFSPMYKNRNLDPNQNVLVTNGAIGSIFAIIMNLVQQGDEVLMFEPFYTQYVNHVEFSGATPVTAPMFTNQDGVWSFDFDHFEKLITEKTKLVMITNPHNPSGKMFTEAEIERLSKILDKHPQVTVLSDDVYYYLPFDGRKHLSFANYSESNWNKTINVFSSGKMLNCTGWKIGWSIGPENLIKQAMFVHESTSFNTNVPGQIALAKSMDQALNQEYKGFVNYLDYTRSVFQSGRDAAIELLSHSKNINFKPTVCESGYFLAVDVTGCED